MGILDNFPHLATARIRTRALDSIGGSRDTFTLVFSAVDCWQQAASEREIAEFMKRGISVTDKVYFLSDPQLDERHVLTVTDKTSGRTELYEVRSYADPDASAGKRVVWRVMVNKTTTSSTG